MGDWAAGGFLDGLDGTARAERAELLDWLEAEGFTPAELRRGHEEGQLAFLPAERIVMGGPPRYTPEEAAALAGVELEDIAQVRRVQGLPPLRPGEPTVGEQEALAFALPAGYRALGFSDEQVLSITRVLGRGLAQVAQTMRSTTLELVVEPGDSERELAERYRDTVARVMPSVGPMVETLLRLHLRTMLGDEIHDAEERRTGRLVGGRTMAVAFADLVGFTKLGEVVEPGELGAVATRLGALAADVAGGPVRVVKQLGDGIMLVADEPEALVLSVLALSEGVRADGGLPQIRAGVAWGPAVHRQGDVYGSAVNLASRVCALARADSVLVTQDVQERLDEDVRCSYAGSRSLKGFKESVRLWRVRPAAPAA